MSNVQPFHLQVNGKKEPFYICVWVHERFCDLQGCDLGEMLDILSKPKVASMRNFIRAAAEYRYYLKKEPIPNWTDDEINSWMDENGGAIAMILRVQEETNPSVSAPDIDEANKKKATPAKRPQRGKN